MRLFRIVIVSIVGFLGYACSDESGGTSSGFGPSAEDPIVSVMLTVMPNETVVFVDSEVQFAWTAIARSGQRYNSLAAALTVPPELTTVDIDTHRYRAPEAGRYEIAVRLAAPYQNISDTLVLEVTDQAPQIFVDYPTRGETIRHQNGGIEVLGRAIATSRLTVNGQNVTLDGEGRFRFPIEPQWGLNILDIQASGAGVVVNSTPSFLYADAYQAVDPSDGIGITVSDAMLFAIAEGFFDDGIHDRNDIDDLATVVEVILEDTDLAAAITESGILDDLGTQRDLGTIAGNQTTLSVNTTVVSPTSVGPTSIQLNTIDGGIAFVGTLGSDDKPALTLRLRVDLTFDILAPDGRTGRATGAIYPTIKVGSGQIEGTLRLNKDPNTPATAQIEGFVLRAQDIQTDPLENVELELDFLGNQTTIDLSDFVSMETFSEEIIDPIINSLVTFLSDVIEPLVEDQSGDLLLRIFDALNLSDTMTIDNLFDSSRPPVEISYESEVNRFNFEEQGVTVGMNLSVYSPPTIPRRNDGSILRTDCLVNRPTVFGNDWSSDLTIALQTDAMNGLLHGIWQSGLITGPVNLSDALGDSSVFAGSELRVVLDPHAPPLLDACKNEEGTTIKLGDLRVELDGRLLSIQMDSTIFADLEMRAFYRADEEGVFLEIGEVLNFDVEIVEVGPDANEDMLRPFLQDQLPVLLNGLLVGQGIGPIELPSLNLSEQIENLEVMDTLDLIPSDVGSRDGYLMIKGDLD